MDNSVANVRINGMFGMVGKRGEAVPLNHSINVPVLTRVISYDEMTSMLTCRFAWAPADSTPLVARVIAPKVGGQAPAGAVCKLRPNDFAYILRNRKSGPTNTNNQDDFEWVSFISGSGVDCQTPIYVDRVFVTPDCVQVQYDKALRENKPEDKPVFSSDYPWANWCLFDVGKVVWSEFDIQSGTMKTYVRAWPIIQKSRETLAVDPTPGSGRCETLGLLFVVDELIGAGSRVYRP